MNTSPFFKIKVFTSSFIFSTFFVLLPFQDHQQLRDVIDILCIHNRVKRAETGRMKKIANSYENSNNIQKNQDWNYTELKSLVILHTASSPFFSLSCNSFHPPPPLVRRKNSFTSKLVIQHRREARQDDLISIPLLSHYFFTCRYVHDEWIRSRCRRNGAGATKQTFSWFTYGVNFYIQKKRRQRPLRCCCIVFLAVLIKYTQHIFFG